MKAASRNCHCPWLTANKETGSSGLRPHRAELRQTFPHSLQMRCWPTQHLNFSCATLSREPSHVVPALATQLWANRWCCSKVTTFVIICSSNRKLIPQQISFYSHYSLTSLHPKANCCLWSICILEFVYIPEKNDVFLYCICSLIYINIVPYMPCYIFSQIYLQIYPFAMHRSGEFLQTAAKHSIVCIHYIFMYAFF